MRQKIYIRNIYQSISNMLFNQLHELIYHNPLSISIEKCDQLLNILGDKGEITIPHENRILEKDLLVEFVNYYQSKNLLTNYELIKLHGINAGEFTIINKDFHNTFDVCHTLSIYKYLMVVYFLDDNSEIIFFNSYTLSPSKGDVIIFPVALFFVYKIIKKNEKNNNVYVFNNILKDF